MAHTKTKWPESTCAECGRHMSAGLMRLCEKGGYCNWHIPAAIREHMESLEAKANPFEAMRDALEDAKMTTYQYEQSLLAQGNTAAAKIYTQRYKELTALLALADKDGE